MEESELKVIIGEAAGRAYFLDHAEKAISMLQRLFEEPEKTNLEQVTGELLASNNLDERTVGFVLQAALQGDLPDPAPIAWRDLALDMLDDVASLVDLMYRIGEISENNEALNEAYRAIQEWQGSTAECVSRMRQGNWTEAKILIDKAHVAAFSPSVEQIVIREPLFQGAMETYREHMRRYRSEILRYPSRIIIRSDRVKTILEVQTIYLRLQQLYSEDTRKNQFIGYPIEKLGDAIAMLLKASSGVEWANYEIGLAAGNLRKALPEIHASDLRKELVDLTDKLDKIFSSLPAKSWPTKGYGHPDVESRFDSETA